MLYVNYISIQKEKEKEKEKKMSLILGGRKRLWMGQKVSNFLSCGSVNL